MRLENERKRAEEDKNAAITALELRSKQFMMEQEQKRQLELKIQAMSSQVLEGGKKI
jgi:kinesin family protein 3/17